MQQCVDGRTFVHTRWDARQGRMAMMMMMMVVVVLTMMLVVVVVICQMVGTTMSKKSLAIGMMRRWYHGCVQ